MDDRRSVDRKRTSRAASIEFGRQTGEHSCEVEVQDIGNGGAGIYKSGLAILPLTFELSLDNLRRRCRMVWRRGNFFGVTFEDQCSPTLIKSEIGEAELAIDEPSFSLLSEPLQVADNTGGLTEFASIIAVRNGDSDSDVGFTIGVVVVLALPVLISLCGYIATTVVFKTG
jgi:hypothetical protein